MMSEPFVLAIGDDGDVEMLVGDASGTSFTGTYEPHECALRVIGADGRVVELSLDMVRDALLGGECSEALDIA